VHVGKAINIVSFSDREFGKAVVHNGDNMTGDGSGDDERIDIDLDCMPPEVQSLFVVVNCYSSGRSFDDVRFFCQWHAELLLCR
jgi:stress response protein SCP2